MKRFIIIVCLIILYSSVSAQDSTTPEINSDIDRPIAPDTNNNFFSDSNRTRNDSYIQTAVEVLEKSAIYYGTIEDLKATLLIRQKNEIFEGTIFVKPPNFMRINFSLPSGQVINNNGNDFYIYIPSQNVVLYQKKQQFSVQGGELFITENGLKLLTQNYLISYLDDPDFEPLEEDPSINVQKLLLRWRNTAQNFRSLILYIGENDLIYKVDAVSYNREQVVFIFSDFEINKGIPDSRFDYKPPPTAHVIEQFLFDDTVALEDESSE